MQALIVAAPPPSPLASAAGYCTSMSRPPPPAMSHPEYLDMDSANTMAAQVVLDVLALRGPGKNTGPFRMVTLAPEHWPAERLRLARKYEKMIPASAAQGDADAIALQLAPYIRRDIGGADFVCGEVGPLMIHS